ncbi:hypothetical protein FV222_06770 [Methylobacterium sp. WL103]|uniref:hypothetical protein n=1 Tax=Methylobacterium sp. WL103 TaxID=2603891 RepID=UPI0011C9802E|nr:hypothetical protein [Methylobacterium sp. WL103]TXN05313.1 hypothetical protein FV222_06770 [Methylobacterium sp. WL103]
MCLPTDLRARVLRATLDAAVDEIRAGGLPPAAAARLADMIADARRHAVELEEELRPVSTEPAPWTPPVMRRRVGYREPGSNVITLRAG